MTTLAQVIEGLRARLASIPGLNVSDHVPGQTIFPAAFIVPPTGLEYDDLAEYDDEGTYMAVFEVPILVGSAVAENQRALIPFLDPRSPGSVFRAVQTDRTLGGLNVDAHVMGAPRRLTFDEVAAYKAWGQIVLVQVVVG
jgi:hypothetical protein